jgi:hypothetical protein
VTVTTPGPARGPGPAGPWQFRWQLNHVTPQSQPECIIVIMMTRMLELEIIGVTVTLKAAAAAAGAAAAAAAATAPLLPRLA